jgi:hypothetical protein
MSGPQKGTNAPGLPPAWSGTTRDAQPDAISNGAAIAAVLAAGIGAFAMGFLVILNETKLFVAPTLYAGAGGLSGRSTFAVITWLAAWALLHARWRARELETGRILAATLVLTAIGAVLCFPPLWGLL